METNEKEFKEVETILRKVYDSEKYMINWFDAELINETIKAMKQIQKKRKKDE